MFTGIIESIGRVSEIKNEGSNRTFTVETDLASELKVDQSLAHNGTCLTVEEVDLSPGSYRVTAIAETLQKTMLGAVKTGDRLNLERSLRADSLVDGHFVQGHVDTTGTVTEILELEGSWEYGISFPAEYEPLIVPRGSICVNGISLTVARSDLHRHLFTVCIIPYTHEHTNIADWSTGDAVNLEFDILGKYVQKIFALRE